DLPQSDGPTTAKNSPRISSRSTGPSACSGAGGRPTVKTLLTLESRTCSTDTGGACARRLFQCLQIVGQKPRIDDLAVIDLALNRADRALRLDHPLQSLHVDLAFAPIRNALRRAGRQVAHGALRDIEIDVVLL